LRVLRATLQTDYAGLRLLDVLGEHRLMWASTTTRTPMAPGRTPGGPPRTTPGAFRLRFSAGRCVTTRESSTGF